MKKYNRIEELKKLSHATLLAIASVSEGDGHSIFGPQAYLDAGMPKELVEAFGEKHTSDGSVKGTIFVDGKAVRALTGVYGLTVVESIANALNLQTGSFMGRGFRAQAAFRAIKAHCDTLPVSS